MTNRVPHSKDAALELLDAASLQCGSLQEHQCINTGKLMLRQALFSPGEVGGMTAGYIAYMIIVTTAQGPDK